MIDPDISSYHPPSCVFVSGFSPSALATLRLARHLTAHLFALFQPFMPLSLFAYFVKLFSQHHVSAHPLTADSAVNVAFFVNR